MNTKARNLSGIVLLWLTGMVLLQFVVEYAFLQPLARRLVLLELDVQENRKKSATIAPNEPQTQVQIDTILMRLPPASKAMSRLGKLHQLADSNGVILKAVNYQDSVLPGPIVLKEISAELSGPYPSVRNYLRELLEAEEALCVLCELLYVLLESPKAFYLNQTQAIQPS
jgi:hypothetical protein